MNKSSLATGLHRVSVSTSGSDVGHSQASTPTDFNNRDSGNGGFLPLLSFSLSLGLCVAILLSLLPQQALAGAIIKSPVNNLLLRTPPNIVLALSAGVPGDDYRVYMNGREITGFAGLNSTGSNYLIWGTQIANTLQPGTNLITAVRRAPVSPGLNLLTEVESFRYDVGGPLIQIESVTALPSDLVRVSGWVTDPGGVAAAWFNDISLVLDSKGRFQVTVPASDQYEITAEDRLGETTRRQYSLSSGLLPRTVSATIGNDGLGPVGELIGEMVVLSKDDLRRYMLERNPIYQGRPSAVTGQVLFDATGLEFEDPYVGLATEPRGSETKLILSGSIPDVVVPLEGTARPCIWFFCIDLPISGSVAIDMAGLSSVAEVAVVNGKITLDLQQFETSLGEFTFSSNWDGVFIISDIINNTVADVLPGALRDALEIPLERVLNDSFQGLNTRIDGSVLDVAVGLEAIPEALYPVSDGLVLRAGVQTEIGSPVGALNLGYPLSGTEVPELLPGAPLEAALSQDLLNQIFWKGQQAGMLDLNMCGALPDLVDAFAIDESLLSALTPATQRLLEEGSFQLQTLAIDSPALSVPGTGAAVGTLTVDGMRVRLVMDAEDLPQENILPFGTGIQSRALDIILNLRADVDIEALPGNRMGIDINGLPLASLRIIRATDYDPQGNVVNINENEVSLTGQTTFYNFLVTLLLPTVIPTIEASLGEIPLPTLAGFSLDIEQFQVAGDGQIGLQGAVSRQGSGDVGLNIPLPEVLARFTPGCQ